MLFAVSISYAVIYTLSKPGRGERCHYFSLCVGFIVLFVILEQIAELEIGDNNKTTLCAYFRPTYLAAAYDDFLSKFKSDEFIEKHRAFFDQHYALGKMTWLNQLETLLGGRVK
jgi:hypothetical protein